MVLPGSMKQHKIEHLCCKPKSQYKSAVGKHWYQCNGCGSIDLGNDKNSRHLLWRNWHFKNCFNDNTKPGTKLKRAVRGTERDFIVAVKQGKVDGVTWDGQRPRDARFEWKVNP